MEQKRVSFKVAKAIKGAGYPQGITEERYLLTGLPTPENPDSKPTYADKPAYLDVWLWLWREKKIELQMLGYHNGKAKCYIERNNIHEDYLSDMIDPEKAIIAAIEYLVDNDLIK